MYYPNCLPVQPSRSPFIRVLSPFKPWPLKPSPLLETCGHREPLTFLPPVTDFSNVTPSAPSTPPFSPFGSASPVELPPLPGPTPIRPFRDVVPYHILSPDHPLNAPQSLSLPRFSPPAESFDDAVTLSKTHMWDPASPVEPPLWCKELESFDESSTEPPVHNVEFFGRKLQHFGRSGGYPRFVQASQSDSDPVQLFHDEGMSVPGFLNTRKAAVQQEPSSTSSSCKAKPGEFTLSDSLT